LWSDNHWTPSKCGYKRTEASTEGPWTVHAPSSGTTLLQCNSVVEPSSPRGKYVGCWMNFWNDLQTRGPARIFQGRLAAHRSKRADQRGAVSGAFSNVFFVRGWPSRGLAPVNPAIRCRCPCSCRHSAVWSLVVWTDVVVAVVLLCFRLHIRILTSVSGMPLGIDQNSASSATVFNHLDTLCPFVTMVSC
jgi:hypothetical protein